MVAMSVNSDRVKELEQELSGIKKAFKEYLAGSRVLESGLDHELGDMHYKLENSASANETLAFQLESMEPVLQSLEKSLGNSKKKLKEETRMRIQAEMEREELEKLYREAESNNFAIRQEYESIREENGALRDGLDENRNQWEDLSSRLESSRQRTWQGSINSNDAILDESYVMVLDELEAVTEQLVATQQNLWKTEDKLRDSESHVRDLKIQKLETVGDKRLQLKIDERESEITLLRQQFKKIFNENSALQQRITRAEGERSESSGLLRKLNEEIEVLKKEKESLSFKANCTDEEHKVALLARDAVWRNKVERACEEVGTKMGRSDGDYGERNKIVKALQGKITLVCKERDSLESKVCDLENNMDWVSKDKMKASQHLREVQAELKFSQNEVLQLKHTVEKLTANLQDSEDSIQKLELERDETLVELGAVQEFIEQADEDESILTINGKNAGTVLTLKETVRKLCSALKTINGDFENANAFAMEAETQKCRSAMKKCVLEQKVKDLEDSLEISRINFMKLTDQFEDTQIKKEVVNQNDNLIDHQLEGSDNTKARLDDLIATTLSATEQEIGNLQKQLRESQFAFDTSILENEQLKKELEMLISEVPEKKCEYNGLGTQILERVRGGKIRERNLQPRDPDANKSIYLKEACDHQNLSKHQSNAAMQFFYHKDPPVIEDRSHEKELQINDFKNSYATQQEPAIVEKELQMTKSLLSKKITELKVSEETLARSQIEIETLGTRVSQLSDDLVQTHKSQAQSNLDDLREQYNKSEGEKFLIKNKLAETKTALSACQNAHEQGKEELVTYKTKLNASLDESKVLKLALSELDGAFSELRQDYELALNDTKNREEFNRTEISGFSLQLKKLADDNNELNKRVVGLEEQLAMSRLEIEEKNDRVHDLEDSLSSAQSEGRILSGEIENLNSALRIAKEEYNHVLLELDAVKDLFEEARKESEHSGMEIATEQIRAEMRREREIQRKEIHEKIENSFNSNRQLLRELTETHKFTSDGSGDKIEELVMSIMDARKETNALREALRSSTDEIKRLRETEVQLNLELGNAKVELRNIKDDFAHTSSSLNRLQGQLQSNSTVLMTGDPFDENEDHKMLRDQIQEMIARLDIDKQPASSRKADNLKIKVELLDISMSLGKIVRDNAILEEELISLRKNLDESRISAQKQGRRDATKEVWAEMKVNRDKEMKAFKEQFYSLAKENVVLEKKMKKYDIALTVAEDARLRSEGEVEKFKNEVVLSKLEAKQHEKEVLKFELELDALKDDSEQEMDKLKTMIRTEREMKLIGLHKQICGLKIENSTLQNKMRIRETEYMSTQNMEMKMNQDMEILVTSLKKSHEVLAQTQADRDRLESKLKRAEAALADSNASQSASEKVIADLNSRLNASSNDLFELKSELLHLNTVLNERNKELLLVQRNYDRTCTEKKQQNKSIDDQDKPDSNKAITIQELLKEKTWLQKEADEAKYALFQSQYEQRKQEDELQKCTDELESFHREFAGHQSIVEAIHSDFMRSKGEIATTMIVLDNINRVLDSVNKIDSEDKLSSDSETLTNSDQVAEQIRERIVSLVSTLQDGSKEPKLDQEREQKLEQHRQQIQLKAAELKYEECQKETSQFKADAIRLQDELEEALNGQEIQRNNLENLNSRVIGLCLEAEERGKEMAKSDLRSSIVDYSQKQLMSSFHEFNEEQSASQPEEANKNTKVNRDLIRGSDSMELTLREEQETNYDDDSDDVKLVRSNDRGSTEAARFSNELRNFHEQFEEQIERAGITKHPNKQSLESMQRLDKNGTDNRTTSSHELNVMDSNIYDA